MRHSVSLNTTAYSVFIFLTLIFPASNTAVAQQLVTDLSDPLIKVESTFTGAKILLFGAVEADNIFLRSLAKDVVVVLRGPGEDITARRKEKVAGIWMNYGSQTFKGIPSYYAVASTRNLKAIASPEVLQRYQIGFENLKFLPGKNKNLSDKADIEKFKKAVIKLKKKDELFVQSPGGVRFLGNTLFRASIELPANVTVGSYSADVYLFRDGKLVHVQNSPLYITKSGFERFIFNMAQRRPTTYGIVAVIIALFFGWLAAVVFRKS
jgi:uncharacterized protein (TIGR02186 family)